MRIGHYFRQLDFLSKEPTILRVGDQDDWAQRDRFKTRFGACASMFFILALSGIVFMFAGRINNLEYAQKSMLTRTVIGDLEPKSMMEYKFFPVL